MARLTTKVALNSLNLDDESISSQIDRLNQVIQAFTSDKLSPLSRFRSSRAASIDSFLDSGKFSVDGSESEEDFYKFFERQSMQSEDFRSHELRQSDKSCLYSKLVLELNQEQLERLCEGLLNVKNNFESSKDRIILTVSGKQLILVLKDRPLTFPNKNLLSLSFSRKKNSISNESSDFGSFSSQDLNDLMSAAFRESFPLTVQTSKSSPSFISTCEQLNSKHHSKELKRLIDKLNWEITEMLYLKESYSNKLQSLNDWEKNLRDKQNDLAIQENQIKNKMVLMEKDLEILSQHRKNIQLEALENKRKQEILKKTLQDIQTNANFLKPFSGLERKNSCEAIIVKPRRAEPKNDFDVEISALENEINSLENIENCQSSRSDLVKTKLDRLKTKLSSLKSKRVINASIERSNSAHKLRIFEHEKKNLIPSHSKPSLKTDPLVSSSSFNCSKSRNENSPKKSTEKMMGTTEEVQKYLKLRENRLNEKEEELSKRENLIFNNLGKLQDNLGLVSIVQNEHRNLKILRNDLEKRQKSLEQQVLNHSRKCSELKVREKEMIESSEIFEKFLKQKKQIESQLSFLVSLFDAGYPGGYGNLVYN